LPTQKYFNQLFSLYAPLYPLVSRVFNKSRKKQVNRIYHFTQSHEIKVLLIGGGDGVDLPFFNNKSSLVYLDAAEKMVQHGQKKYGHYAHIKFVHADILNFRSEAQFDVVCLHFCLSVTANPQEMIQSAVKLLKPNGYISVIDVADHPKNRMRSTVNKLTRLSMFDLQLNIARLITKEGLNLQLLESERLAEMRLFSSYMYEKKSKI